jgi:hypothetical protein
MLRVTGRVLLSAAATYLSGLCPAATLRCSFHPVPAYLNFGLQAEAGYVLQFPFHQFQGPHHSIDVHLHIAPISGSGASVDVANHFELPPVPDTSVKGEVAGSFNISPGTYAVSSVAEDDAGRSCRDDWTITAKDAIHRPHAAVRPPLDRLSVFLDVAPLNSRAPSLAAIDVVRLTSSLRSLMEELPAGDVRLVAFSLDSAKVIQWKDGFLPSDLDGLKAALVAIQFGTVDYKHLRDGPSPSAFLDALIRRETSDSRQADAVVFLGPFSRDRGYPIRPGAAVRSVGRNFWYLEYRRGQDYLAYRPQPRDFVGSTDRGEGFRREPLPPAEMKDVISREIDEIGGHTFVILNGTDFANALSRIVRNTQ